MKPKVNIALYYFVPYMNDRGTIPSTEIEMILSFKSLSCKHLTAWSLKLCLKFQFTALLSYTKQAGVSEG